MQGKETADNDIGAEYSMLIGAQGGIGIPLGKTSTALGVVSPFSSGSK